MIGHVVEDLAYENIDPSRFQAELVGWEKTPQYKREGYFIFSDLRQGDYTLKITGERLQSTILKVVIPAKPPVFLDSRGDNELIVIVRSIGEAIENNGRKKITFDPVILIREIRAGARVVSNSLPADTDAKLAATMEAGTVSEARVENADGLAADSIVRIIRGRSIRMNFDPYYLFASPITQVVGKVVSKQNPSIPLAGARVRVTKLNDAAITSNDIQGVAIFTGVDISGNRIVLGAEKDVSVVTNEKGDYNLYFSNETLASYMITDKSLEAVKDDKVRAALKAEAFKNKVFRGFERFLAALREEMSREKIGSEILLKHQPLILQHSENFIRNLTLEVTLAGFKPASELVQIKTSERKSVGFQLVKM